MYTNSNRRLLYFSPFGSGGLADYAHEQAQALTQIGVQVTLLAPPNYHKADAQYKLQQTLKAYGTVRSPLALLRKSVFAAHLLQNYAILASTIQRQGFQHVLFGSYAEYMAPLWAPFLSQLPHQGIKFGAVVHDPVRDYVLGPLWWHRWSIAHAYSFLQEAFVHEAINLDTVKSMPGLQTTVIPHGAYEFTPPQHTQAQMRQELRLPNHAKVLLSFGHIRDGKNLDLALKAIADCSEEIYLVVAGNVSADTQRPASYYQNLATELGIADRCRWLIGFIPEAKVGDLFNACDAVLLTYSASFQSASGVLNAAVAYRKPCIASSGASNLKTMVRQYNLGVWVEPDNWNAICSGIEQWQQGMASPRWEDYVRDNSWAKNAAIVCSRFWGDVVE
jgi:glycosyltransferase involved in cell wall biosynthesis